MESINKSFSLGLIGFTEVQQRTFLAIFSLAERGLQHTWHIVDEVYADFFVLATEKSESDALINAKNLPRTRCLFCTQQELEPSGYDTDVLFLSLGQVPQLSSLIKTLNHAASIGFSAQPPIDSSALTSLVESQQSDSANAEAVFDPVHSFLPQLLNNPSKRGEFHFGSSTLYADFVTNVYYCETSLIDLSPYFNEDVSLHVIADRDWQQVIEQSGLSAKPLANLIWYVAFKLSAGRLLAGHSNQDNVHLTRWPDLSIPSCSKYVKLAAFMCNNAVCLNTVAERTTIPLDEVYSFYNACYLIGIIEKIEKPELYAKTLDEDKKQLLTKITNRLKKINNR